MAAVEGEGLRGEEMERDGVAGEGVDDEHVEFLRAFTGQGGAGVAGNDVDVRAGFADVGEDVAGDGFDSGVDLVEADAVAGTAVSGDGPGAEADDADVALHLRC